VKTVFLRFGRLVMRLSFLRTRRRRSLLVQMVEQVVHLRLLLFLQEQERVEGGHETPGEREVHAEADLHARKIEREMRQDGKAGEDDDHRDDRDEKPDDLPALLPHETGTSRKRDHADQEEIQMQEQDGDADERRVKTEPGVGNHFPAEPFAGYPRRKNADEGGNGSPVQYFLFERKPENVSEHPLRHGGSILPLMRIAIDVREACRADRTGKGQWTYGFVRELLARGRPVLLLTDSALPAPWDNAAASLAFSRGLSWHFRAALALKRSREDTLVISPTSFIVPILTGRSVKTVPVIHDLIALRGGQHDRKAVLIERLLLKRALKTAAHVLTVSDATKDELLRRFPFLEERGVTAVYAGPSKSAFPARTPDGETILSIGTLCPRKNQLRLIEAYRRLPGRVRARCALVLAGGRGWRDADIVDRAMHTDGVVWKGYVPRDEHERLLRTCEILAFPSLDEGFGLPVLDALARGVPVLASDRPSLREIAGPSAVFVDPESVDSIRQGLLRLLTDRHLRDALRTAGPPRAGRYSWQRTVDLALDAFARCYTSSVSNRYVRPSQSSSPLPSLPAHPKPVGEGR